VLEWCADSFAEDAYSKHERNNPIYEETGASLRVLRGGSWNNNPWNVRSANRNRSEPTTRFSDIGARLLRKC
ncbi:Sulphatase-modifying factor domain protein, partial [Candidatus Magnetomorum sp. HK-1]